MKEYMIEFNYRGYDTVLDLRRVVAITRPKNGKFLIYFENAIWSVDESEFDDVYSSWLLAL